MSKYINIDTKTIKEKIIQSGIVEDNRLSLPTDYIFILNLVDEIESLKQRIGMLEEGYGELLNKITGLMDECEINFGKLSIQLEKIYLKLMK